MNPTAIYSKSGKGVQEASGKTSNLGRADRAVLSAFDGRLTVKDVAERVGRPFDAKFEQLIGQLDRDGYIREVSAGASSGAGAAKPAAKPGVTPAKPAAAPAKSGGGEDLDFTIAIPASPAPKPPPPKAATATPAAAARAEADKKVSEDAMTRARREAEERQQKERDKIKAETEAKLRVETEAKMRSEAAQKAKEAEAKAKKDAEEKIKAEADAKVKAAREAAVKAAFEAERKAKEETDRIRKEAEEKARKEAAELQKKLDEERRAREEAERARQEAERKAREEAERARKEAEEKARKEAAELQRKLDEERRAREEAERRAREEAERARKEAERAKQEAERAAREQAERVKKDAERAAREQADREAREQAERSLREEEQRRSAAADAAAEAERAARELIEAQAEQAKHQEPEKEAPKGKDAGFDSLLADLDSFSDREDEEKKAKEEADRKAREEKAHRQREEAEAKAREDAEKKKREAAEREQAEAKAREDAERKKREAEELERQLEEERQAEERKRKRREEAAAKEATTDKGDDIGVSDDDLGMDDVKADEEQVSKESRKAQRAREKEAKEREREARERAREVKREEKRATAGPAAPPVGGYRPIRRRRSWGKPIALLLFVALIAGVGYLHIMPINTQDYEKGASAAIGLPVRIGTAHLSVYRGLVLTLENISVGDLKIPVGRAYPEIGSLFDEKKMLTRLELEGVTLPQEAIGAFLNTKLRNDKFYVGRLVVNKIKLPGPLPLPTLDADVTVGPQGSISVIELRGPDNFAAKLTPRGETDVDFEATASGFPIPFLPDVTLSTFAMKGRATREAARIESWGGAIVGGAVNGNANVRWTGGTWALDGTMTLRGINAATFAPALLSEGNAEGTARFSMSDPDPSKFKSVGRVEGSFLINRGVLGSFDLSRAILTGGRQATGRTPFIEMNGQGIFDRGAVTLRNVTFGAGAMNATANADISPEGALSGRIVADIKTAAQQLRATINVGGTVGEPQVK